MKNISIQITRRIKHGHLSYTLEGNFKPFPCGSMIESNVRDLFRRQTGVSGSNEGLFFCLIDRENHATIHTRLYHEYYLDKRGMPSAGAPDREIKFIGLRPTDLLYHAVTDETKGGIEGLKQEYQMILDIIDTARDSEDTIIIELEKPV